MDQSKIEKHQERTWEVKPERQSQKWGQKWERRGNLETEGGRWRGETCEVEGGSSPSLLVDDDELLWQRQSGWNVNASVLEDAVSARLSPPMGKWDGWLQHKHTNTGRHTEMHTHAPRDTYNNRTNLWRNGSYICWLLVCVCTGDVLE